MSVDGSPVLEFRSALETPWVDMAPLRVGPVPATLGTPDAYLLVSERAAPVARIDLYHHADDYHFRRAALAWADWIVIGVGHRVHFVRLADRHVLQLELGSYFGSLEASGNRLFVASAECVFCVGTGAALQWRSPEVGIDGVVIQDIDAREVRGAGEWDPPGGWRPFRLSAATGELQEQTP